MKQMASHILRKAGRPKGSKTHNRTKRTNLHTSQSKFITAIKGSNGIKSVIAERLSISVWTVNNRLRKEGWEAVQQAYEEEIERVGDVAENTLIRAMDQKDDLAIAAKTAQWYLERRCKERGYASQSKLTLEGGDKPIQVEGVIDVTKLPIALKRQILEELERDDKTVGKQE